MACEWKREKKQRRAIICFAIGFFFFSSFFSRCHPVFVLFIFLYRILFFVMLFVFFYAIFVRQFFEKKQTVLSPLIEYSWFEYLFRCTFAQKSDVEWNSIKLNFSEIKCNMQGAADGVHEYALLLCTREYSYDLAAAKLQRWKSNELSSVSAQDKQVTLWEQVKKKV